MKSSKKSLTILFIVILFLLSAKISAYANISNNFQSMGLNSENFIEYINNLYIDKEDIEDIINKGKEVAEKVQDKSDISDFSVTQILNIYTDISYIAHNLNLNIDFSFKNGDFILKENGKKDIIFQGNINELEEYFNFYKNNINVLVKEVLGSIDNKEVIENIEEVVEEDIEASMETLNNDSKIANNENQSNEKNKVSEDIKNNNMSIDKTDNNLGIGKIENTNDDYIKNNKNFTPKAMFYTFILFGSLFTIVVAYIKLKK